MKRAKWVALLVLVVGGVWWITGPSHRSLAARLETQLHEFEQLLGQLGEHPVQYLTLQFLHDGTMSVDGEKNDGEHLYAIVDRDGTVRPQFDSNGVPGYSPERAAAFGLSEVRLAEYRRMLLVLDLDFVDFSRPHCWFAWRDGRDARDLPSKGVFFEPEPRRTNTVEYQATHVEGWYTFKFGPWWTQR